MKRYCKDCKWSVYFGAPVSGVGNAAFYECVHPARQSISPVTGEAALQSGLCIHAREKGKFCGPKAVRFEAK